jgi:hypothetical protein
MRGLIAIWYSIGCRVGKQDLFRGRSVQYVGRVIEESDHCCFSDRVRVSKAGERTLDVLDHNRRPQNRGGDSAARPRQQF